MSDDKWRDRANCKGADVNIFFPVDHDYSLAKAYCDECKVQDDCLADALDNDQRDWSGVRYGYFGNKTPAQRRKLAKAIPMERRTRGEPTHGTVSRYNKGCKCNACKQANADYHAHHKRTRTRRGLAPDDPRHGTISGYASFGCKCARCKQANNDKTKAWKKGKGQAQ